MEAQAAFPVAFLGLLLTGIGGPLLGLLGATLYEGHTVSFFSRAGRFVGPALMGVTLAFLGPLAVLPRCVTVAHAALLPIWPSLSLAAFALLFSLLALLCCWRRRFLLPALGYILSPSLILCLLLIIVQGVRHTGVLGESMLSQTEAFFLGIETGYDTMDLVASIYFSAGIWTLVSLQSKGDVKATFSTTVKAGALGCALLALMYMGLAHAAARFAPILQGVPKEELMSRLALEALGPHLGLVANVAIALACLTTVISLTMTISDILVQEVLVPSVRYQEVALTILLVSGLLANLGFDTIMSLIHPMAVLCYPLIILLTLYNIFGKLRAPRGAE
jgi:LIVCS family branched-chain amino acid:cation transporter